jgi:hypothetical protein
MNNILIVLKHGMLVANGNMNGTQEILLVKVIMRVLKLAPSSFTYVIIKMQ